MFDEDKCPISLLPNKEIGRSSEENDFSALTDEKSLKNAIVDLCNNLCHPVAVFDYSQLQLNRKTANKLELEVSPFSLRISCSLLRTCAGDQLCFDCDCFHASCMDVDQIMIEKRIQDSISERPTFFYSEYENNPPHVLSDYDRPIIEYYCPILGYRELIFPIFYRGKVFGTLYIGQILVYSEGDIDKVYKIREGFFTKNDSEKLFEAYIEKYNSLSSGDEHISSDIIEKLIKKSDQYTEVFDHFLNFQSTGNNRISHYFKSFNTMKEYSGFLQKVCEEIEKLEYRLASEYEARRERFFQSVLRGITDGFIRDYSSNNNISFSSKHDERVENLKCAWELLREATKKIMEKFNFIESIIVYGDGESLGMEDSGIKKAQFSLQENSRGMTYDFSYAKLLGSFENLNSLEKTEIIDGLKGNSSVKNRILILWQDIAMLLQVRDLEIHKSLYEILCRAIGKHFERINSIIALCTANLMKEKLLLTMRMYRHENAHISARMKDNMTQYFGEDGNRFCSLSLEKRKLILNDTLSAIQLISNITDKIGLITGSINEQSPLVYEAEKFDVSDMLYKLQTMFYHELKDRNLDIVILRNTEADLLPGICFTESMNSYISDITGDNTQLYEKAGRYITTNPKLFELLVYNLIENAVKYAYRGTNIYLIWCRIGRKYRLSVTSYGPEMEPGDTMYDLYTRGSSPMNRFQKGDGLGLYVVKRISQLLKLQVRHTSVKIAEHNLPLISWYQNADFSSDQNYEKIPPLILETYDRKQAQFAINKNPKTAIIDNDLTRIYLKKRIGFETWRTTFSVDIAQNVKNKKGKLLC